LSARDKILDTFLVLLREQSTVSTRSLAQSTGLSKGTLYHHFKDMNEICVHAHELSFQKIMDDLPRDLPGSMEKNLLTFSRNFVKVMGDAGEQRVIKYFHLAAENIPDLKSSLQERVIRLRELVESFLLKGLAQREREVLADLHLFQLQGIAMQEHLFEGGKDRELRLKRSVDTLVRLAFV